jgi:hypothetical protein
MENQVHIPVPCHENWSNMSVSDKGRFCESCEKEVVDFTSKSREQIIDHLETSSGNTCGRVNAHQLDTAPETCSTTASSSNFKFIYSMKSVGLSLMAFLGFGLLPNLADAQVVGEIPVRKMGKMAYSAHEENTNKRMVTLTGLVRDEGIRTPIVNANITVESEGRMIADGFTDEQGRYHLNIRPGKIYNDKVTVTAYAKDYEPRVIADIPVAKAKVTMDFDLSGGWVIMGDMAFEELIIEEPVQVVEQVQMLQGEMMITHSEPVIDEIDAENPELPISVEETVEVEVLLTDPVGEEGQEDLTNPENGEAILPENAVTLENHAPAPNRMTLYPNPVSNDCFIELAQSNDYTIELFDNTGRHVYSDSFAGVKTTINVDKLERGVYHVRILALKGDYSETLELVVQ